MHGAPTGYNQRNLSKIATSGLVLTDLYREVAVHFNITSAHTLQIIISLYYWAYIQNARSLAATNPSHSVVSEVKRLPDKKLCTVI